MLAIKYNKQMIIFDGNQFAKEKEEVLRRQVEELAERGVRLKIAAVLFSEDSGSLLYTQKKQQAANRVGIEYQAYQFSMTDSIEEVTQQIESLNNDVSVTGIIIQKPTRVTYNSVVEKNTKQKLSFQDWWQLLTSKIVLNKDVDGLHPQTLQAVKNNTWREKGFVLPATARAVLQIMKSAQLQLEDKKVIILGKSDILGQPLFYELQNQGVAVEMIGSKELKKRIDQGLSLFDADVIVSATGRHHLINGSMIQAGVTLIDVGEPLPDIDLQTVQDKAAFITPVPGGVGPVTVVCLLENCVIIHTS